MTTTSEISTDYRVLTHEIAAALGWHVVWDSEASLHWIAKEPIKASTPGEAPTITDRGDVATLVLRYDGYGFRGKVQVQGGAYVLAADGRGQYAGDLERGAKDPVMYAATPRGAAVIAKEIARKIIPEHTRLHNLAIAKRDAGKTERVENRAVAEHAAGLLGMRIVSNPRDELDIDLQGHSFDGPVQTRDARVSYGRVKLELSVDPLTNEGKKILALIGELTR